MKKTTFEASEAGHRFIELYAEPVVTNSYLKIALIVLTIVALALFALMYRSQTAASRLKPLVISVSDIGRCQVMNYDDFSKIPIDRVSQYYLARWAELYYVRNYETLQRVNQQKTLQTFLLNPSTPDLDIRIDAVNLIDLRSRSAACPSVRSNRKARSSAAGT